MTKHIGWHTFRRTVASLLLASGASVKVSQELLGHASPVITLGVYAQAMNDDKRSAQHALAQLISQPEIGEANATIAA